MKYSWEEVWGNINRKETALSFVVCMLLGVGYLNIFLPEGKIISDILPTKNIETHSLPGNQSFYIAIPTHHHQKKTQQLFHIEESKLRIGL